MKVDHNDVEKKMVFEWLTAIQDLAANLSGMAMSC